MGLVFTPAISVATSGVEPRYAGVTAATANTAMQIGSSVGTAVLNSLAVAATAAYAASHPLGDQQEALVHGYATATGWSAVALALDRSGRRRPDPQSQAHRTPEGALRCPSS